MTFGLTEEYYTKTLRRGFFHDSIHLTSLLECPDWCTNVTLTNLKFRHNVNTYRFDVWDELIFLQLNYMKEKQLLRGDWKGCGMRHWNNVSYTWLRKEEKWVFSHGEWLSTAR